MRTSFAWVAAVGLAGASTVACGPDSDSPPGAGGTGATGGSTGGSGASAGSGGSASGAGGTTGGSAGNGSGGTTGGSAGTGGASGGGAGKGGTGGGSGAGGGGTAGAGGSTPYGIIQYGTLLHYPSDGAMRPLATAQFYRSSARTLDTCQRTEMGPCAVTDCRVMTNPPDTDPPVPDTEPAPDAGAITIRSTGTFTADLTPDGKGIYVQSGVMGSLVGEESVTVTAAGGDVPAFTHTMTYPLLLLLTEPAFDDTQTEYAVSRADDLVLSWDRGTPEGKLQVQSQNSAAALVCVFDAQAGTGTIPSDLLSSLDQGADLLLLGSRSETITAGDYEVRVSSAGVVMTPDRTRRAMIVLE